MLHPNPIPALRRPRAGRTRAALRRRGPSRVVAVRRHGDRWVRLVHPSAFTPDQVRDLRAAGYAALLVRRGDTVRTLSIEAPRRIGAVTA